MKLTIFFSIIGILFMFCETAGTRLSNCDRRGSVRSRNNTDKGCKCKANVIGQKCDQCKPNTFDLSQPNPLGCTECFCMGITKTCQSLSWPKGVIEQWFTRSSKADSKYGYFLLPEKFLKNLLLSYGQVLILTIDSINTVVSTDPIEDVSDIEIFSETKNITLSYWYPRALSESFSKEPNTEKIVSLQENSWYLPDDMQASRSQFLMALAEITNIKIRIEYGTLRCAISKVQLQTAVENYNGKQKVLNVEKCNCPSGYTGTSCEKCALGYTRSSVEPYLGNCEVNCNGHAHEWDEHTQSCVNCAHNTAGEHCHLCAPGYEGNARTDEGCRSSRPVGNSAESEMNQHDAACICEGNVAAEGCDCPGPLISSDSAKIIDKIESVKCDERGSIQLMSDANGRCKCKANVMGPTCNQCKPNTFDLASDNFLGCKKCFCMGITQTCQSLAWPKGLIEYSFQSFNSEEWQRNDVHLLPEKFLGNRLLSYGGALTLKFRCSKQPPTSSIPSTHEGDIEILSKNQNIELRYRDNGLIDPSSCHVTPTNEKTVFLIENQWFLVNGSSVSRSQFLMALADISSIRIKWKYPEFHLVLYEATLETAIENANGGNLMYEVEKCQCPAGYTGTSCEECASGYTRTHVGPYLGICERNPCNGHSKKCGVETESRKNCSHNTAGKCCHSCARGVPERATTEKNYELPKPPSQSDCTCNLIGSEKDQCNGNCICKQNVEGERCDRCKPSTFGLLAENEYGCNKCFCSGVTDQCHESSYYYQKISGIGDADSSLKLIDGETGDSVNDGMEIGYRIRGAKLNDFFWILPRIYYGNRGKSYGGYLRLIEEFYGAYEVVYESTTIITDITMSGSGIKLITQNRPLKFNRILNYTIPLRESSWLVSNENNRQATREEFMRVLINLEQIAVLASVTKGVEAVYIRDISMDEAVVDYSPGLHQTTQIEICECPRGYSGESCETCSPGYYRDSRDEGLSVFGACESCPCSGHWKSCELSETEEIVCHCVAGYSGEGCELEWQLSVSMRVQPERQTVEPDGVATLTCVIDFRDVDEEADFLDHDGPSLNSQIQLEWIREDGDLLPSDSTVSDNILTISNVQREDTGVYICRGFKSGEGEFIWAKSYLHVGVRPKIKLTPNNETVDVGDVISIDCHASGDSPMTIKWTAMYRNLLPGEVDDGHGRLTFNGIATSDVGRYICNATNEAGTTLAVAQILTTPSDCN